MTTAGGPRQFKRVARVLVQRHLDPTTGKPLAAGSPSLSSQFDGLRVEFKIEKTPVITPNTAEIKIYNVAEPNRRSMQDRDTLVELSAGYANDSMDNIVRLFKGNARTIDHTREGANWVTKIQCGDGELGYRYSEASVGLKGATSYADAATYLANQIKGVDVSAFIAKIKKEGIVGSFTNGVSFFGNASEELSRLMQAAGYQTSIQDGELQAIALTSTNETLVQVLRPDNGLIGSPEHGTPEKGGLPSVLKAKCLLRGQIRPGDRVQFGGLRDDRIQGDYRVIKLTHTGDTHGPAWTTELECRPTKI